MGPALRTSDGVPLMATGLEKCINIKILSPVKYSPGTDETSVINGCLLSTCMLEFDPNEPGVPGKAQSKLVSTDGLVLA